MDYISFAISGGLAGLFHKADVILTTSPQFFVNFSGYALGKLKGRPWFFELRDLWPESIRTVGAMQESKILDVLERMELFFYRSAKKVVAVTPAFKRNLVQRGIDPHKVEVIPNGSNLELFRPGEDKAGLKQSLGLDGLFVVSYIGTHGMAHSLPFIVRSIARLGDQVVGESVSQ